MIINNELFIRKVYAVFYSGNAFHCNICNKKLSSFVLNFRNEKTCPKCGGLGRDRRLWEVISKDFSPSRSLARKFKTIDNIKY